MKTAIQLKTKQQFKEVMLQHKAKWKVWMWDTFREETCYIPSENCFISLDRAKKLDYEIEDTEKV